MFKKIFKSLDVNQNMLSKLNWHNTNSTILLQWEKRGIIHTGSDLKFRKLMCYFSIFLFLIVFLFLISLPLQDKDITLLLKVGLILGLLFLLSPIAILLGLEILGSKFYSYEITIKKLELVSWKEELLYIKPVSTFLLWVFIFFVVLVFILEPSALLVGFGGVTAVGAIAGAKLFSKDYIETHLEYQHLLTTWDKVSKIEITEPLNTVYIWGDNLNDKEQTRDLFYLFYTPENKQQLFQLVKEKAQQYNLEIHYTNE